MTDISANELQSQGINAIQAALAAQSEATISVQGKQCFVVMDIAHYHYLRECELLAALSESHADIQAGRYVTESAAEHLTRLESMA